MKLNGKTAVVTGGALGIGLSTSVRLIKAGVTVTIWDINKDNLKEAVKKLEDLGGKAYGTVCDVTDSTAVKKAAAKAFKDMGQVDILVNNAGYVQGGDFLEVSEESLLKTIDVNLTSMIYTIRAFLPGMYERNSGSVVNISSAAGLLGTANLAVYCASKWGVYGLTEALRHEAVNRKKKGVHFSSIHPSYLKTGMFEGARLNILGRLVVPSIKDHDVIAKCIVNSAIKRGRHSPKRPLSVHTVPVLRGLLPDSWFQGIIRFLGVQKSMSTWHGR
jgi:all-trans-retinol dehydrogenase (NAD+)